MPHPSPPHPTRHATAPYSQLAVYSIDTLTKNITPPIVTWRENIDEANRRGACECVVDVLKLHPGNEVRLFARLPTSTTTTTIA